MYIYTHVYRCWTNNKQQKVENFKSINMWYTYNTTSTTTSTSTSTNQHPLTSLASSEEDGRERGGGGGKHKLDVCNAYTKFLQLGPII